METWKEFDHNVITHSAAHHLMAVDDLIGRFGYARVSDVARELNITRGSVSISLKPLKDSGLLLQDEHKHVRLSDSGRALVAAIKTKRMLFKRLLHQVLGIDEETADVDACKVEHLISNETARRMVSFLKFMDSDDRRSRDFRTAWALFDPTCASTASGCPTCKTSCMVQAVK